MLKHNLPVLLSIAIIGGCGPPASDPDKPRNALANSEKRSDPAADDIDPALITYRQTAEIPAGLQKVRALAVGPDNIWYVAGDKAIRVVAPKGGMTIALEGEPQCLAVVGDESSAQMRIYVGLEDHVEVWNAKGTRIATWKSLGEQAALTSIAVAEQDVFVADAGNKIVWHYDANGKVLGRIGARDEARKIPGFLVTDRHFDLGVGPDGLLYVVNPQALRIEGYTFKGDLEVHWGKGSPALEGFFGCCNPVHFTILPDGRFVTAEKGIPRIKVYSTQGKFECVVAGPRQMRAVAADLAVDSRGRILALDPTSASVRVFEETKTAKKPNE